MMRGRIALLLLSCLLASHLEAQSAPQVWAQAGVGGGWAGVSCTGCTGHDRTSAVTGMAAVGLRVYDRTRLGIEGVLWRHGTGPGTSERILGLSGVIQVEPAPRVPVYLRLGLGALLYRSQGTDAALTSMSLTPSLGVGMRLGLTSSLAVSPYVTYMRPIAGGTASINGQSDGFRLQPNLLLAGISLGFN